MRDTELLYKYNGTGDKNYRFDKESKSMIFEFEDEILNGNTIRKILGNIINFQKNMDVSKYQLPFIFPFVVLLF